MKDASSHSRVDAAEDGRVVVQQARRRAAGDGERVGDETFKIVLHASNQGFTPSPGTPGEGWGEGILTRSRSTGLQPDRDAR